MQRIKGLEFRALAMCCSQPGDAMNHLRMHLSRSDANAMWQPPGLASDCFVGVAKPGSYLAKQVTTQQLHQHCLGFTRGSSGSANSKFNVSFHAAGCEVRR